MNKEEKGSKVTRQMLIEQVSKINKLAPFIFDMFRILLEDEDIEDLNYKLKEYLEIYDDYIKEAHNLCDLIFKLDYLLLKVNKNIHDEYVNIIDEIKEQNNLNQLIYLLEVE